MHEQRAFPTTPHTLNQAQIFLLRWDLNLAMPYIPVKIINSPAMGTHKLPLLTGLREVQRIHRAF